MNSDSNDSIVIANAMRDEAAALMRFAQAAHHDYADANTDSVLFQGASRGVPVLLTLATEIALKAWQRRDSGDHDRDHHLLRLYKSERITPASRAAIAGALGAVPAGEYPKLGIHGLVDPEAYIRAVLNDHACTFVEARYVIETLIRRGALIVQTGALERVLEALVRAYSRASP